MIELFHSLFKVYPKICRLLTIAYVSNLFNRFPKQIRFLLWVTHISVGHYCVQAGPLADMVPYRKQTPFIERKKGFCKRGPGDVFHPVN